jgi:hypothetical protein
MVTASFAAMRSTASSGRYRKCAAECAKLAWAAPSLHARHSFSAAAKSWLALAMLEEGSPRLNVSAVSANGLFVRSDCPYIRRVHVAAVSPLQGSRQ